MARKDIASKKRKRDRRLPPPPAPSAPPAPRGQRISPDYSYVPAELKKIGIIAGAMILLLIVLSFVLK